MSHWSLCILAIVKGSKGRHLGPKSGNQVGLFSHCSLAPQNSIHRQRPIGCDQVNFVNFTTHVSDLDQTDLDQGIVGQVDEKKTKKQVVKIPTGYQKAPKGKTLEEYLGIWFPPAKRKAQRQSRECKASPRED